VHPAGNVNNALRVFGGDELTGIRLGDQEENKSLFRGQSRDVDVLVLLVLQNMAGKRVPDVNGREVCAGGPLCGLVELSLNNDAEYQCP